MCLFEIFGKKQNKLAIFLPTFHIVIANYCIVLIHGEAWHVRCELEIPLEQSIWRYVQ